MQSSGLLAVELAGTEKLLKLHALADIYIIIDILIYIYIFSVYIQAASS